MTKQTRAFT